jgi:hypothetical protein
VQDVGISYEQVTGHLQEEGVQRFADSFDKLFQCLDSKRKAVGERRVAQG